MVAIEFGKLFFSELNVTESTNHFEYFAARWEHATAGSLVFVHRSHEVDFFVVVFTLTSRWIDVATTLLLSTGCFSLGANRDRSLFFSTFFASTIESNDVVLESQVSSGGSCHAKVPGKMVGEPPPWSI
jgi:hypothetical protein